ncbi:hypothetical protein Tco_1189653 [Tanacetum coccineum]
MGEPLSSDRVFDFLVDEPDPHPAYDFFVPGPLPGYAGNPNNNNGWIKADAEEQVVTPVVDTDEDIAMLFGDDDFEDDDSEGLDEEEVWEVKEEWLMAPVTPPPMPAVPPIERLRGSSAAEGFADSAAADYNFRDEQSGEHVDAVHFEDG